MEAEPSRELGGEVERMAPEEDEQAGESSAEAMEAAPSEAALTVGDLTSVHRQDACSA